MSELTVFLIAVIILSLMFGSLLLLQRHMQKTGQLTTGQGTACEAQASAAQPSTQRPARQVVAPPAQQQPPPPAAQAAPRPEASIEVPEWLRLLFVTTRANERGHTFLAAKTGDGKTQSAIALMVKDIKHGAQVVWCSPQPALYHPTDQPTDLRPVAHMFTLVSDYAEILRVLKAAYAVGDERKPLYQAGRDVGHNIVIYLEEWPAIVLAFKSEPELKPLYDDLIATASRIIRECRKLNIWLVLAAQDAQVQTTGLHTGLIASFTTKLAGNVDQTTWGYVAGTGFKRTAVGQGFWMTEKGLIKVIRPPALYIERLAQTAPRDFVPLALSGDDEQWLSSDLEPDVRTGSSGSERADSEGEPVNEPAVVREPPTAVLADTTAVQALPDDDLSKAIRGLVHVGLSRNKIIGLLPIPGGRADQLRRIKVALGELVEEPV